MRINKVLDSGEMKIYPEIKMKDKNMSLYLECLRKSKEYIEKTIFSEELCEMVKVKSVNPDYEEYPPRLVYATNKMMEYGSNINNYGPNMQRKSYEIFVKCATEEKIYEYLGKIPFYPCVMLNISPNWKGSAITDNLIEGFRRVIEGYLGSCGRYSKWKYCCESGSEGNFLHAHIVAEINPDLLKSVETHINKGNHAVEIRKLWKKNKWKAKKHEDAVSGKFSIQRIMIRTEEMRDDKLAYLIEENKPETHRNKYDLGMIYNSGF